MDEITFLGAGGVFSPLAPANFANARKDICNCLLFSVVVNPCSRSRLHLKQSSPHRRVDTLLLRDRSLPVRTRRLGGSPIECAGADNANSRFAVRRPGFNRRIRHRFALSHDGLHG